MKQERTKQKIVKLPVLEVDEDIKKKLKEEAQRQGVNDMSIIRRKAYQAYLN